MSEKGKKKKGKKSDASNDKDDSCNSSDMKMLDEAKIQAYQAKIGDLTEKLNRLGEKFNVISKENIILSQVQSKGTQDRQDIVEFLNINVREQDTKIAHLEELVTKLENECTNQKAESKQRYDALNETSSKSINELQGLNSKYKSELDSLIEFRDNKLKMENQIHSLEILLQDREKEYKEVIHSMERKILQDKNAIKKEMLQKVNEAVINFRKVADQQMAETTKRAIRENMAITSQLKKMSFKTTELINENEKLTTRVHKLRTNNEILTESESQLATKNQANQKVIRMLVEKLKESDKMLSIAYDNKVIFDNNKVIFDNVESESEPNKEIEKPKEPVQQNTPKESEPKELHDLSTELIDVLSRVIQDGLTSDEEISQATVINVEDFQISGVPLSKFYDLVDRLKGINNPKTEGIEQIEQVQEKEIPALQPKKPHPTTIRPKKPSKEPTILSIMSHIPSTKKAIELSKTLNIALLDGSGTDGVSVEGYIENARLPPMHDTHVRTVGVQTKPQPFASNKIRTTHLLSKLRPWGPSSLSLPKTGLGIYTHRKFNVFSPKTSYYTPHVMQPDEGSLVGLFDGTASTEVSMSSGSLSSLF